MVLVLQLLLKHQNADENNKSVIEKALKRTFSPEFLNRIDDVIVFNSLDKEHIIQIIDISDEGCNETLETWVYLELTEEARKFIAEKGYDQQFGARPLHRAIQKYLEDPLAEEILNHNIKEGDKAIADYDQTQEKIVFSVSKGKDKKEKTETKD